MNSENKHLTTPEAIDLLEKMLLYDHNERITAEEALNHPFLSPVKHQYSNIN